MNVSIQHDLTSDEEQIPGYIAFLYDASNFEFVVRTHKINRLINLVRGFFG